MDNNQKCGPRRLIVLNFTLKVIMWNFPDNILCKYVLRTFIWFLYFNLFSISVLYWLQTHRIFA